MTYIFFPISEWGRSLAFASSWFSFCNTTDDFNLYWYTIKVVR